MKKMIALLKKWTRPARMAWNKLYREKYTFPKLSKDTLRAVIRHEAHRVEKAYYNNVFSDKKKVYMEKSDNIKLLIKLFGKKGGDVFDPDINWAKKIASNADKLNEDFITYNDTKHDISSYFCSKKDRENLIASLFHERRSVRVWSNDQPSLYEKNQLAERLIRCAVNMPCSGNRQAVRFICFVEKKQKDLLKGIKEKHCYDAPLVIGVFSDEKLYGSYGSFSNTEECLYIDSAAAASAILIAAELEGYSTCWNHFGLDLVMSRKLNRERYKAIKLAYSLPDSVRPIALIAIGKEAFQPPTPLRMPLSEYIYND